MNENKKAQIINLLNHYKTYQERIALLRYELQHPAHISQNEMIDALSFSRGEGGTVSLGHISNKTYYAAKEFKAETERANMEVTREIADRLIKLEGIVDRMDYYMTFLKEQERQVIEACFFEEQSIQKASETLGFSMWTVRKLRESAVERLTEMYSYVEEGV